MELTATDILELLSKALKLEYDTYVYKINDGYELEIDLIIPGYGRSPQRVIITNKNESNWDGDYDFNTMMNVLDEELEKQKQKEEKEQKRKELINSLTPEQRELLGV